MMKCQLKMISNKSAVWLLMWLYFIGLHEFGADSKPLAEDVVSLSYVRLPTRYTAMKGDISVNFNIGDRDLSNLTLSRGNFKGMIHLWYMPGDSYLLSPLHQGQGGRKAYIHQGNTGKQHKSYLDGVPVASLAIPLGVRSGTIIFPCGAILQAGPHRALLTINGRDVAASPLLNVQWPSIALVNVPTHLETYSNDVEITAKFTTNMCSQMLLTPTDVSEQSSGENYIESSKYLGSKSRLRKLPFEAYLELVHCPSVSNGRYQEQVVSDCQAPASHKDPRVWFSKRISHLYSRSSVRVNINCSFWGQEGSFRIFVRTNLTHMAVIARSNQIQVMINTEYHLGSYFSSILPCVQNDIKTLTVQRPYCAPMSDKVRAFGQVQELIGDDIFAIKKREYLGEVRMRKGENIAIFPCEVFHRGRKSDSWKDRETNSIDIDNKNSDSKPDFWRYCFDYVTTNMKGSINTTTTFCMPAKLEDAEIPAPTWSGWEPWSECSVTCGNGGTKFRNRVCQIPQNHLRHLDCKGEPIQVKECGAKQEVCPPPPRIYHDDRETSEEAKKKEKIEQTKDPSNNAIYTQEDIRKELDAWKPLKDGDSKSPCACGCIYIVTGSQRTATITSSPQCYSLPIVWKVKVPNNKTISATLDLVEFSCLNSVLKIRDPMKGNEIIHIEKSTFEKSKMQSSIHNKTNANSMHGSPRNDHDYQVKENKTENVLKSENGQFLIIEYLAPRRSCRVNIKVTAFANELNKTDETNTGFKYYFDKYLGQSRISYFYQKHPMIIISLLSIFIVTFLCVFCLVCQFKYEKRKYQKWFHQQHHRENKFRRKSSSLYSNSLYMINPGQNGYVPVNTKTNIEDDDAETIASVVEDEHLLLDHSRKVSRRKLIQILNRRFQKASQILQMQKNKKENLSHRMCRTNSIPLPCEPFKRAKDDNHVYENINNILSDTSAKENGNILVGNNLITATQVKRALASKIKRCKKGTYSVKILKNRSPPPAPSTSPIHLVEPLVVATSSDGTSTLKRKRYSRSFSDLLSIIELDESKTEKLLIQRRVSNDNNASLNTNNNNVSNKTAFTTTTTTTASIETIVQNQEVDILKNEKRKEIGSKKVVKNTLMSDTESCSSLYHMTGSTTNCEASHHSTLSRKRRRLIDKQTKNRLNERRMSRKRMLANQQQLLQQKGIKNGNIQLASMSSNSTLNSISRSESLNTLKPPKGKRNVGGGQQSSLSEFSEHSSMELDLEFDLYDCDLNNVIASNQPGSMFAHQNNFYDFYDFEDDDDLGALTPTPSRTDFDVTGPHPNRGGEMIEMSRLLPNTAMETSNKETRNSFDEKDLDCEVVIRRKKNSNDRNEEQNGNEDNKMLMSRTSDLTASITSNDLTIRAFDSPTIYYKATNDRLTPKSLRKEGSLGCYDNDEDDFDGDDIDSGGGGSNSGGLSETDTLLSSKKASHILNLTHIEDNDICFADD